MAWTPCGRLRHRSSARYFLPARRPTPRGTRARFTARSQPDGAQRVRFSCRDWRQTQTKETCHANIANGYAEHPCAAAIAGRQLGAGACALPDLLATVLSYDV